MKLDAYIKDKFVHTKKTNPIKLLYILYHKYIKKFSKESYSFGGVDLLVNHFFRDKKEGIYLDIGCYHPKNGSNTYLLYKKGWNGINIDLDEASIDLFNSFRPRDYNKKIAISDYKGKTTLFTYHKRSAGQTIDSETAKLRSTQVKEEIEVECNTLNSVIEESHFKDKKIDFLSIDIEGAEVEALSKFDFKKYNPSLVVIEYNDKELKQVEFYHQRVENIFNSEIYNLLVENGYKFVNWHHADLIFVADSIYNKRQINN